MLSTNRGACLRGASDYQLLLGNSAGPGSCTSLASSRRQSRPIASPPIVASYNGLSALCPSSASIPSKPLPLQQQQLQQQRARGKSVMMTAVADEQADITAVRCAP